MRRFAGVAATAPLLPGCLRLRGSLDLDGGKAQCLPGLHATAVPLELVGGVTKRDELADVGGQLSAPQAVAMEAGIPADHVPCALFALVREARSNA